MTIAKNTIVISGKKDRKKKEINQIGKHAQEDIWTRMVIAE